MFPLSRYVRALDPDTDPDDYGDDEDGDEDEEGNEEEEDEDEEGDDGNGEKWYVARS